MWTMKLNLIQFLIFSFISTLPALFSPEENIARIIKNTLAETSSTEIRTMMENHLKQMRLMMTNNNVWSHQILENIAYYLLPRSINEKDLALLVDDMAENASRNPYLQSFLLQAIGPDFKDVLTKVKEEGYKVFLHIVSYAMVLDRLINAMRADYKVLEACSQVWSEQLQPLQCNKYNLLNTFLKKSSIPLFNLAKTFSVQPVVDDIVSCLRSGQVPPTFGRVMLPLNILEAKLLDFLEGNFANVGVALILAKQKPQKEENHCSGAGPTLLSVDGQAIQFNLALPLKWADLYQTWNMAFVTNYNSWPYFLTKLLIPSVSGYQANPSEYLYNRVLALITHINWVLMGEMYKDEAEGKNITWRSKTLTRSWGRINYQSAMEYEHAISLCS